MTERDEPSIGELVTRLTQQFTTLVRDEIQLAQAELVQKAKKTGIGAGLFGGAGLVAMLGMGALVAAAIVGLGNAVDYWLAALIVGLVLLLVAGVLGLLGRRQLSDAGPPIPQESISGVHKDIDAVREGLHR
jgi:uncharacterized membrane protein YqjE